MDEIVAELHKVAPARRRKFRAVFSTACFGATHLDGWLDAGFKVASGSPGIYADSALSFPAFLAPWANGTTFEVAVAAANAADPLRGQEALAKEFFRSKGRPDEANEVNSVRVIKGNGFLKMDSAP